VRWGAQDVSAHEQGAYTGEVSAPMLAECGCRYALVGHSERRAYHAESDKLVADKAKAAAGTRRDAHRLRRRDPGRTRRRQTEAVVKRQLSAVIHTLAHCAGEIVVAYEPVWAIGTGRTATPEQAQAGARGAARAVAGRHRPWRRMKILYGGSVKADNAATLFAQPDIDGGLIGGASLKAADFVAICRAAA
jgi:triosephosphate isomerase